MIETAQVDTSAEFNFSATANAIAKIAELIGEEQNNKINLRIFVQGGGCSGFSYGFSFDDTIGEEDFIVEVGSGIKIVVDYMSAQYVNGSEVDYEEEFMGSQFVVRNPNAVSTCGCGSSFSPF